MSTKGTFLAQACSSWGCPWTNAARSLEPVPVFRKRGDVPPSPPQVPSRGCFSLAISSGNFHCPGLFLLPSLYSSSPPDTTLWPQVFSPVITLTLQPGSFSFLPQLRAFSVPCPVHSSSPPHSQHSLAQGKSCTSLAAPLLSLSSLRLYIAQLCL